MAPLDIQSSKEPLLEVEHDDPKSSGTYDPDPPNVRYLSWGIFEIAYEVTSEPLLSFPTSSMLFPYRKPFQFLLRFLQDLWHIARWHCVEYYTYTLWLAFAPALSLCLASLVIFNVDLLFKAGFRGKSEDVMDCIKVQVFAWLFCGLMTYRIENMMSELRVKIGGSLRAHFIPKLVQASLEWDPNDLDESYGSFPYPHDYGDFIPGWEFLEETFDRIRHISVIVLEVLAMTCIISLFDESFEANLLSGSMLLFLITTFCSPMNTAGGAGYTFWTTNADYNRLMVLFNIVFDHQYRLTLVKDGLVDYFIDEYKRVSKSLGVVDADTWILGWSLPPPWCWGFAQSWIIKDPMALCAIFIPWATSSSIIRAMIIFQYAIFSIRHNVESLKHARTHNSFLGIITKVERFYQILDKPPAARGLLDYPANPNNKGAKIILDNVSYEYPTSNDPAVNNVNLTIQPGQLIVIAGTNGSGKTTLVKLISGLMQPTQGEILIDDTKLPRYNLNKFRQAIAFVSQSEAIYPVSLRENILLGLASPSDRDSIAESDLDDAAHLGGSTHFIKQHGYDAVLNPCSLVGYSIREQPGRAAVQALERNTPDPKGIPISTGEHQRLIASRAFMRLKHGNIKLIILDEPSNALDIIAERQVFQQFREIARRHGQTMIIVTHRLASVAKYADLILCMNKGKIEERGTHDDLIADGCRYSSLYNAQALVE